MKRRILRTVTPKVRYILGILFFTLLVGVAFEYRRSKSEPATWKVGGEGELVFTVN